MSRRSRRRQRVARKHRWFKNTPRRLAERVLDTIERFDPQRTPDHSDLQLAIDALPEEGGTVNVGGVPMIFKPFEINKPNFQIVGVDTTIKVVNGHGAVFEVSESIAASKMKGHR